LLYRRIEEAVRTLNQYAILSRKVDSTLGVVGRQKKATMGDLETVANIFGFSLPKKEEKEMEEEPELTEEDIREIKRIVDKYKQKRE